MEYKDLPRLDAIAKKFAHLPLAEYEQQIAYLFEAIEAEAKVFAGTSIKNGLMELAFDILLARIKQGEW